MPFVKLKLNWPGGRFHRVVRDDRDNVVRDIEFLAGVPVEVTKQELKFLKLRDVGPALEMCEQPSSAELERMKARLAARGIKLDADDGDEPAAEEVTGQAGPGLGDSPPAGE